MRRWMGTRPLPKNQHRVRTKRGAWALRPWLHDASPPAVVYGRAVQRLAAALPRHAKVTVASAWDGDRMNYSFVGHKLVSASGNPWAASLRCEEALLREIEDQEQRRKLAITGEALQLSPSGSLCVYGSKETIESMVNKSSYKPNTEGMTGFALALPLAQIQEMSDVDSLQKYLVDAAKQQLPTIDDLVASRRRSNGIYRILSASRAIASADPNTFIYILAESTNSKREPMRLTLPGGKRLPFETSHKCAQRCLTEETRLSVNVTYDQPAVHVASSSEKMILFMHNAGGVPQVALNSYCHDSYASRFTSPPFVQRASQGLI